MIIQIAGTSGSGKSHAMRRFLDWARQQGKVDEDFVDERNSPFGYYVTLPKFRSIYVVGSYRTPTGGCDTISDVKRVYQLIQEMHDEGNHVLYEGLFVMNMTRGPVLAEKYGEELCVLQLNTPYAVCIASINSRRAERGEGKLHKKENTKGNYARAESYCKVMKGAGARVLRVSRGMVFPQMISLLQMVDH